jgi:hypothetical protein
MRICKKCSGKNKKKLSSAKRKYYRDKRRKNINYKLSHTVSRGIYGILKGKSYYKDDLSFLNFLDYSMPELKIHIEKQFLLPGNKWMSWNNWKKYNSKTWIDGDESTYTWNIDHIIPQSNLPYTSMRDDNFKKCWALENLRPYSAKQNILDGASRIRHKKAE